MSLLSTLNIFKSCIIIFNQRLKIHHFIALFSLRSKFTLIDFLSSASCGVSTCLHCCLKLVRINKFLLWLLLQKKFGKYFNYIRWLLGLRKLRSSKKVEILQVVLVLRVGSWKKRVFLKWRKETAFFFLVFLFVIFTMKLSSTASSYLNAHSTLNFARTFIFLNINTIKHQKSKTWIL